ncbi:LPS export ABC transporter permease LptG [Microbulbifer halophilus]|uniref:LPS export ABC transporter permease LptG n=1 Tax=Microbulbifer halophilus TaxID=453963 RepID=A0ABW5E979_9GAMM|nr:LPS export ABC transporter permease LptG [Microbulbifer halophilus]MCW8125295.1 LPS export ABC transporter permease LptG [Microbulbifer halophilus]
MSKLDRYIGRAVASAIVAVLLVIMGLDLIFAYIDEMGDLSETYRATDILRYLLWTLPAQVYEYLGFAALVGCLIGLGTLASTSELTVMRAAGMSVARITWSVMKPVLLIIFLGLALAEFVIPHTSQSAEKFKSMATGQLEDAGLDQGLWMTDDGEFVHFNAALPGGELFGVTRYRFDDERHLERVVFSEGGVFDDDQWLLQNNRATTFTEESVGSEVESDSVWETDISPNLFALVVPLPSDLSPRNLWAYGTFLDGKGQDSSRYWLQFWKKVLQPLTIASLVMVAISFIFGPLRTVTTGLRVFTGVIVGIVFQTVQDMLGPSSVVFGFPPLIAVLLPVLLCFGLGWMLLKRAR